MTILEIIELIGWIATALGLISSLIIAISRGQMKAFIIEKMEEAEESGKSGKEKLEYVILAVKDKYKLLTIFINIKNVVEKIIATTKKINYKGE